MAGRRFRSKGRFGEPTGMVAAGIRRIKDKGRAGTRGQGKIRVMDNKAETRGRVETHSPLWEIAVGGMADLAPADFPNVEKDRQRNAKTAVPPDKPQIPGDKITNTADPMRLPRSMLMGVRGPIRCWV